ncbi:hypothetical protein K458DRAFT_392584 [Lentithecium fluviatile CBS 122367]|uniref:Uncharacterized protein n=1 Tax=Lentithecium fluviatile CBS 122367 TaxID=1168545 RepID=A0A6G1ISR9_9PLEO|nr:hypothetical protein K458DRAFT_392584 [Lentithecium fluviatile CBS 122367]
MLPRPGGFLFMREPTAGESLDRCCSSSETTDRNLRGDRLGRRTDLTPAKVRDQRPGSRTTITSSPTEDFYYSANGYKSQQDPSVCSSLSKSVNGACSPCRPLHLSNASQAHADQWQALTPPRADNSKMQALLFNVLTVILAAGTLVVAFIHIVHQWRQIRGRDVEHHDHDAFADEGRRVERMDSSGTERTLTPVLGVGEAAGLYAIELEEFEPKELDLQNPEADEGRMEAPGPPDLQTEEARGGEIEVEKGDTAISESRKGGEDWSSYFRR